MPTTSRPRAELDESTMVGSRVAGRALSAGAVAKIGVIVYVLSALLNSSSLVTSANDLRAGSLARRIFHPLADANRSLSRALHTDDLGERVDRWRGEKGGTGDFGFTTTTTTESTTDTVAPPVTGPGNPGSSAPDTTTSTTPEPEPTSLRVPRPGDPLRVYVAGDSLVQSWGESLQRLAAGSQLISIPTADFHAATGLMRPDKFDWPKRLQEEVRARRPDVVIVGFGGNDGQPIEVDGKSAAVGSPEWMTEYHRRVASTLDFLTGSLRVVIWVGTPMARDAGLFESQRIINDIYRDEVSRRPTVKFVDTWQIFASPEGTYAAYLDVGGEIKLVRRDDGFHLTTIGADKLAGEIYQLLDAEVRARGGG